MEKAVTFLSGVIGTLSGLALAWFTFLSDYQFKLNDQQFDQIRFDVETAQASRNFDFELFKFVIGTFEDTQTQTNDQKQRVLLAFFQSQEEGPFRNAVLAMFSQEGGSREVQKAASRALWADSQDAADVAAQTPAPPVEPSDPQDGTPSAIEDRIPFVERITSGDPSRWDIDVFVCGGANAAPGTIANATLLFEALSVRASNGDLGTVRLRAAPAAGLTSHRERGLSGTYLIYDSYPEEEETSLNLVAAAQRDLGIPMARYANPATASRWYMSFFFCP